MENHYFQLIKCSMRRVDPKYILLDVAGGAPKHRERVYCYELYHQMRAVQESDIKSYDFTINGEIDKSGPQKITSNFNPDFVMHVPGSMKNNGCVVEVKVKKNVSNGRGDLDKSKIEKDLRTIICMIHCHDYTSGALILIDVDFQKAKQLLRSLDIPHLDKHSKDIMVFHQSKNNPNEITQVLLSDVRRQHAIDLLSKGD